MPIITRGLGGSYMEQMGVVNGVPQYYTTLDNNKAHDSSQVLIDKDQIKIWANTNGVFSDTLFSDGSRLFILKIQNGKPIYSMTKSKKLEK